MMSPALIKTLLRPAKVAFLPSTPQATGPGGQPVDPAAAAGGAPPGGAPPAGAMEMPPGAPPGDPAAAGAPPADPAAAGMPPAPPEPPAPDPSAGMPPPPSDPSAGGETMVPLNAITNFATSIIEATKGKRTAEAAAAEAAADKAGGGAPGEQPALGAITGLPMGEGGASGPLKLASVIVRRAKLAAAPSPAPQPAAAPAPAPAPAPAAAPALSKGALQPQVMAQRASKVTQFLKQQPPKA